MRRSFPTSFVFGRANLAVITGGRSTPAAPPEPYDPFAGHVARDHGELAIRLADLRLAARGGASVDHEITAVITGWEAHR